MWSKKTQNYEKNMNKTFKCSLVLELKTEAGRFLKILCEGQKAIQIWLKNDPMFLY